VEVRGLHLNSNISKIATVQARLQRLSDDVHAYSTSGVEHSLLRGSSIHKVSRRLGSLSVRDGSYECVGDCRLFDRGLCQKAVVGHVCDMTPSSRFAQADRLALIYRSIAGALDLRNKATMRNRCAQERNCSHAETQNLKPPFSTRELRTTADCRLHS
jgi:hypothetical protein